MGLAYTVCRLIENRRQVPHVRDREHWVQKFALTTVKLPLRAKEAGAK